MHFDVSARSFPFLHKKRVTLKCLNDFMVLKMNLQDIPRIKPSSLHLRHFSCKPYHVTNTTALFRVPFQGCGTTRGIKDSFITLSNAVENSLSKNESRASVSSRALVSHALELQFPFTCYYRQKYIITIQEGERHGAGNNSGEKQRLEGEIMSISSCYHGDSLTYSLRYFDAPFISCFLILIFRFIFQYILKLKISIFCFRPDRLYVSVFLWSCDGNWKAFVKFFSEKIKKGAEI